MGDLRSLVDPVSERVLGACIEVHRRLGPGLLEACYEKCVCLELELRGIRFERQVALPVLYKGLRLEQSYRLDLLVEDSLVVEIKAVEQLLPVHVSQTLTYLRLGNFPTGLLINFNQATLKAGVRRLTPNKAPQGSLPPISL